MRDSSRARADFMTLAFMVPMLSWVWLFGVWLFGNYITPTFGRRPIKNKTIWDYIGQENERER